MATQYVNPYDRTQVDAFVRHYRNQHGLGGISVYRGQRLQSGAGLGNILASIGRFLLPIVIPAAKTFIGSTLRAKSEGKSIKEAAKEALAPTLSQAIEGTSKQIQNRLMAGRQSGSGRRRKRRGVKKQKGGRRRRKQGSRKKQLVYKGMFGGGRKRKSSNKRSKSRKRVRYLKPAFANF